MNTDLKNRILSYENDLSSLVNKDRDPENLIKVVIRELNAEKLSVSVKKLEPNSFVQLKGDDTEYVVFCLPEGDTSKHFGVLLLQKGDTLKNFFGEEKQLREVSL